MDSTHPHGNVHGKVQGAATKDYPFYLDATIDPEEPVYLRVNLASLRHALRDNPAWADTPFERDEHTFNILRYGRAMTTILQGSAIYTPELGSEHGRVRVLNGRHRLYALIDLGYSHARIVTAPSHAAVLGALVDPVDSAQDHSSHR